MIFSVIVLPILFSGALGAAIRADGGSCSMPCNLVPDHLVCGSDRVTYRNQCYFRMAQCRSPTLQKVKDGACPGVRRGIVCTTPMCTPIYDPVCGSDGRTYDNECSLFNAKCEDERLKLEHRGPCTAAVFD